MRRGLVVLLLVGGTAAPAAADQNDLVLSRLATPVTDGSGNTTSFVGDNLRFRSLTSQLGTVLAPHLLTPADTIGFGGFQLTVDYAMTTIDAGQDYWRVRNGGTDNTMRTVGLFMRKGMWFPIPSFELGGGAIHLVDSRIWTGQLYAKFALHEGYHQLPIPSLSVRGGVSRMMNQRELDLTVASLDVAISKHFGVGGTWRFDPFVGWNLLMIIPRSEVIDPTPDVDPLVMGNEQDILLNFVFKDQDNIYRNRIFVGAKFQYYVFQFTLEAQFALAGSSKDDRTGTNDACMAGSTTSNCDATDTAAAQRTLSLSAGFDF
jgi:hypothetical protein